MNEKERKQWLDEYLSGIDWLEASYEWFQGSLPQEADFGDELPSTGEVTISDFRTAQGFQIELGHAYLVRLQAQIEGFAKALGWQTSGKGVNATNIFRELGARLSSDGEKEGLSGLRELRNEFGHNLSSEKHVLPTHMRNYFQLARKLGPIVLTCSSESEANAA